MPVKIGPRDGVMRSGQEKRRRRNRHQTCFAEERRRGPQ